MRSGWCWIIPVHDSRIFQDLVASDSDQMINERHIVALRYGHDFGEVEEGFVHTVSVT